MTGDLSTDLLSLVVITFIAATVNGALGYGFSSLTVPVAMLFFTNRVLNPCLLLVELVVNAYVLMVNRRAVPRVWRRVLPLMGGLVPGVVVGSTVLALVNPEWLKFGIFIVLLPLILVQAAGVRRPIRAEKRFSLAFGGGVGVLYSLTTISGPPLALLLNNQGFAKAEFRAALAMVRLAESALTAIAYLALGLFTIESLQLVPYVTPSVLIGIPLGTYLISRISAETFRRVCMSFDAWAVGFGLSSTLRHLGLVLGPAAFGVLLATIAVDGLLLVRYFRGTRPFRRTHAHPEPTPALSP
ncbi:MAG: sulfite exporter TauE/SafE family protein [Acidobacteria bacterium]|nr:sulfite exporter TauE/SafE family protein [Acidobacteriota bacterium]